MLDDIHISMHAWEYLEFRCDKELTKLYRRITMEMAEETRERWPRKPMRFFEGVESHEALGTAYTHGGSDLSPPP
jgi:hypothetical protein